MIHIELFFLTLLGLILYIYVGYPFILFLVSKIIRSKVIKNDDFIPTVSLIISTYNEENYIERKIKNCLALDYPKEKLEIIIGSEAVDNTNEIIRKYENQGIQLITFPNQRREGKPATLYRIIPKARGEIIALTDVNALWQATALRKLVRNFADDRVGCVVGKLRYNCGMPHEDTGENAYWTFETFIKHSEGRIMSVLGANGSIYAIRKSLYAPLNYYRGDDFELPIQVKIQGYGVVFEPDAISVEQLVPNTAVEFSRKVRIISWVIPSAIILLLKAIKLRRWILAFQLISHKLFRWLVPFLWLMAFLFNAFLTSKTIYIFSFFIQLFIFVLAIVGYLTERFRLQAPRIVKIFYYFCAINLASLISWFKIRNKGAENLWDPIRRY